MNCVQACPSNNMEPIIKYSEYINSTMDKEEGPFDRNFEQRISKLKILSTNGLP